MTRLYGYNSTLGLDNSVSGGTNFIIYDSQNSQGTNDSNNFHYTPASSPESVTVNGNGAHGTFEGTGFSTTSVDGVLTPTGGTVDTLTIDFSGGNTSDLSIDQFSLPLVDLFNADWSYFETSVFGGADDIWGSLFGDNLFGYAGNDELIGDFGNDTLNGGDGDDVLFGDDKEGTRYRNNSTSPVTEYDPEDYLADYGDNDTLFGNAGNDTLNGGLGDDVLNGGTGADELNGGSGSNTASYDGSASGVAVSLATGAAVGGDADGDVLQDISSLIGSEHDDNLTGDDAANTLSGGAGDDTLNGGAGADLIDGGEGDSDTATYAASSSAVQVNLGTSTATGGDAQGDEIYNVENLIGSDHSDSLNGNTSNNNLAGGEGNDTLNGLDGDDLLLGGAGADSLEGGAGDDTLEGGDSNDHVHGGAGNDDLSGGDGDDHFMGGSGDDTMEGGDGSDTFVLTLGMGDDIITDFEFGTDLLDFAGGSDSGVTYSENSDGDREINLSDGSRLTLIDVPLNHAATGNVSISGSTDIGDTLSAETSSIEDLDGLGDFELQWMRDGQAISGATGSSYEITNADGGSALTVSVTFTDDIGNDESLDSNSIEIAAVVTGEEINGNRRGNRLEGTDADSDINGKGGRDNLYGNGGDDTLAGGNGNDKLFGGKGHDVLNGGAGKDILRGNKGDDTLDGGAGADKFIFSRGDGSDLIDNFNALADKIVIKRGASDFSDLDISRSGSDVEISFKNVTITLSDFALADVSEDFFIL
jgi:Ca2+-binding RTX toxin-like protein